MASSFMHLHAHSKFSCNDAIQDVAEMVRLAAKWGQPGVALTDHGNMSGTVQLYQAGKKYGVPVFPGFEGYLVEDHHDAAAKRYHFGLLATTLGGFRALTAFSSLSHTRPRFNRFPRHDLADLAELADTPAARDLVLLTGCYFGFVQQTLVDKGAKAARRVVEMYASWFPNTVVEIQNHNITHPDGATDADMVIELVGIADRLGLPVAATQDSHYLNIGDKAAHDAMKRIVYRQGDVNEFPGDSFHFASTEWVEQHHTPKHWRRSEEGHAFVLGLNKLELPALDKYQPQVPKMSKTPQADLEQLCIRALDRLADDKRLAEKRGEGPRKAFQRYRDRMFYELGIIKQLGYADYFLHVLDFVTWCRKNKIFVEARGSANGSLVCFLIGVTQIEPLAWKYVTFERFMSPDRQKPPDIDIDIEDTRRPEAVAYTQNKYRAISIGNYSVLGSREDDDKGSVLVAYNAYLRSTMSPVAFNARFGKGVERIADIKHISKKDYQGVRRLAEHTPYKSYGVHAAGLLLSGSNMKISDYVPTMLVPSSNTIVSQYTMDDLDALGYMKDDILGQRTLRVMTRCQELMGRRDPMDFSWIPMDDPETCTELSKGRMDNAIFQFEGYAMAKGARSLGIRNTEDCILAGALFRPACIDSGVTDLYLKRRNSAVLRNNLRYPHPAFERSLKSTYGCVLFQEQVLEIMRGLGMDYAGINKFFKIVKDSGKGATARNIERAQEVRQQWDEICDRNNITDREGAWHYIEGYVRYGFNACITGDTVLTRSSGNQYQSREITVEQLYEDWNSDKPVGVKYRRQGLQIMAHDNGRVMVDKVKGVYYQGRQDVWKITLKNGASITATKNHRHLSNTGWHRVDDLTIGDKLATMGDREKFNNPRGTGELPSLHNGRYLLAEEIREIGECEWCREDQGRLEIAHLDHDRTNNVRSNLRLLCNSCHKQHDWDTGRRKVRHSRGRPVIYSRIVSIEYMGKQHTYDVEMIGEDHSFVANGIVTHNSHATGYGVRSYRCGYLKTHYPLEYMTAALESVAGKPKKTGKQYSQEDLYVKETRRIGIRILPPDVTLSGAKWTMDGRRNAITKGLASVKGVGEAAEAIVAARQERPFTSLQDLAERLPAGVLTGRNQYLDLVAGRTKRDGTPRGGWIGKMKALKEAGAFKSLGVEAGD